MVSCIVQWLTVTAVSYMILNKCFKVGWHHVNNLLFQSELSASTSELLTVIGSEEEERKELEPGDLMSFAQQIASGMVSAEMYLTLAWGIYGPIMDLLYHIQVLCLQKTSWNGPKISGVVGLSIVHIPPRTIHRSSWLDCRWCTETLPAGMCWLQTERFWR